jgi:transposase
MAYRELGVIEVREVLRRFCAGDGLRAIARATHVDRKTVAKFVAAATSVGLRGGIPAPLRTRSRPSSPRGAPHGRRAEVPDAWRSTAPTSRSGWPRACGRRRSIAGCANRA